LLIRVLSYSVNFSSHVIVISNNQANSLTGNAVGNMVVKHILSLNAL